MKTTAANNVLAVDQLLTQLNLGVSVYPIVELYLQQCQNVTQERRRIVAR